MSIPRFSTQAEKELPEFSLLCPEQSSFHLKVWRLRADPENGPGTEIPCGLSIRRPHSEVAHFHSLRNEKVQPTAAVAFVRPKVTLGSNLFRTRRSESGCII